MAEHDVFISYASSDNTPLSEGQEGWVRSFERLLRDHLVSFTGNRQVEVWFDERKVDALTPITEVILNAVENSRLMISVVSPSYINSRWCMDELNHFRFTKQRRGGLLLGNKSLLVKIAKIPVDREELPDVFQDLKGVEFFKPQGPGEMPEWFGLEEAGEARQLFINTVRSVAYSIALVIKQLKKGSAPAGGAKSSAPYIYFAEPTPDLKEKCGMLKLELEQRGYNIYSLDEEVLPQSFSELERTVRDNMKGCYLAIHMIGAEYGESPSDDIRSYSFLENMIATEIERSAGFSRLIWIPQGVAPKEKAQDKFLEVIRLTDWPGRTEWIENSWENFKAVVDDKIKSAGASAAAAAATPSVLPPNAKARVYVVFDKQDAEQGQAAGRELKAKGYDVIGPTLSGSESTLAEAHRAKLKLCDAVLIIWDKVPDTWVLEKVGDLEKIRGYGRETPFRSKAVLISGEPGFEKDFFSSTQTLVIKSLSDGTTESSLDDFLTQLK
jgi:hypothetical protein